MLRIIDQKVTIDLVPISRVPLTDNGIVIHNRAAMPKSGTDHRGDSANRIWKRLLFNQIKCQSIISEVCNPWVYRRSTETMNAMAFLSSCLGTRDILSYKVTCL